MDRFVVGRNFRDVQRFNSPIDFDDDDVTRTYRIEVTVYNFVLVYRAAIW